MIKDKIKNVIDALFFALAPGLWLKYHFPEIYKEEKEK